MRSKLLTLSILWALLCALSPAQASVVVTAQVDRTIVSPGESLQMQVKVIGGNGDVDLSPIHDFLVRSLGTTSSVHLLNNQMIKEVSYNYLLIPRKGGKLTVPALTVTVDGQPHRTDAITIMVSDQPQSGAHGHSQGKDVWVEAEVMEAAPFAGQQVIYTFRFYRAVPIDKANFKAPDFKGFSFNEVKDRHAYRKVINGREYSVTEVYFVLTPLEAGEWTVDPAVVNVGVIRKRRGRSISPFDDFFDRGVVEPRVLQTQPIKITVQPLPRLQPPMEFSGLVGKFDITAETETTHLAVGDSATLTITLHGKGNISDAPFPNLVIPSAFKSYADHPEDEVVVDRYGVSGKRIFRTALVPVTPGRFPLRPIQVTYFDVEKESYHTLTSPLPTLVVVPDADSQGTPLTVTPGHLPLFKKKVAFTGRDILPPKESLAAIESHTPMKWPYFIMLVLAPALFCGAITLTWHIRRPDNSANATMKARARDAMKHAAAASGEAFLSSLYQAMTAAIFSAADRKGEALTWKEAKMLLLENRFSEEEADEAAKLLAEIESIKFGGKSLSDDHRGVLLEQTRTMVRKIAP